MACQLYHWLGIQGRGALVRLTLEVPGEPCVDVSRPERSER
ncbi:hypothetical protein [Polaromonas sp. CG9_12]|nr:hypothetical protein [Polaromonas sp. CG9_12]